MIGLQHRYIRTTALICSNHLTLPHVTFLSLRWRDSWSTQWIRNWWMVSLKEVLSTCPSGDQWQVAFHEDPYWDWCCLISLLGSWAVGSTVPSASLLVTLNCGCSLEGRGAIHRDLDRLGRWACVNLRESSTKPKTGSSSEDMELELVQRRLMKMIRGQDHFPHGTRLKEFGLFSLKKTWLWRDLTALSSI